MFYINLSYNEFCIIEDFNFLEFMDSITDIDVRGNICSDLDSKRFINTMKKRFEFLEMINGVEVMKAG